MKMRVKVLTLLAILILAVFVALYIIVSTVFLQSFSSLEREKTVESVTRTTNMLSIELTDISSRVSDWAFWDDTYSFVQTLNESYILLNLDDSVFTNLRLNLMLFINTSGKIVYGKAFALNNNTETTIPQGITEEISSAPPLWNFTTKDGRMEGIILLPQEPLLFSSQPILTSDEEGPMEGALIMGRYLDYTEIGYLANTLGFSIMTDRYNDPQIQKDFQLARSSLSNTSPIFIEPLDSDYIGGYALVNDVFSNPALILRIDLPRDIYKQGLMTVNYFLVSVAALCIVFGAAMVILLEKGILSSLSGLTKTVKEMGTKEYNSHDFSRFGNDETSILADAIKDAISQRLAAIEELAGMVGHDLRNPLAGINGAAYYLRTRYESRLDTKGKEMLKIIEDSVIYSNKIVDDLLEYSRKIRLQYVDTTPNMLMKAAFSLVSLPKNIKLIDLTENKTKIKVDAEKMNRVFINLINNSVDAMPEGGLLTIENKNVRNSIEFSFTDTGIGMSKETLKKICSPLFTTKAKGMGFGLPISKRIVEAHGGSLSFASTVGKGTKATIILPTKTKSETIDEM